LGGFVVFLLFWRLWALSAIDPSDTGCFAPPVPERRAPTCRMALFGREPSAWLALLRQCRSAPAERVMQITSWLISSGLDVLFRERKITFF